jgi:serine phosphatase RsbU (regulator of sigma subunit)
MKLRARSIRGKLLLSFLVFLVITIGIVGLGFWLNARKDSIQAISLLLAQTNSEIQRAKRLESDFLKDDVINPDYYQTEQSVYLQERAIILTKINQKLKALEENYEIKHTAIATQIARLNQRFIHYETDFVQIQKQILKRGFKNFGLEGLMRENIHALEKAVNRYGLDLAKMLTIRRIEKDFILRKEWHYTTDIKKAIQSFRSDIETKVANPTLYPQLLRYLYKYDSLFMQVANLERTIGFTQKSGLRKTLDESAQSIEAIIQQLTQEITAKMHRLATQSYSTFITGIVVAIVILIVLIIYTTRTLGAPITTLSASIHRVIGHNFSREIAFERVHSRDEIGQLSHDFAFMLDKVQQSMEELRTQAEHIAQKQQAVQKSINYAQKIQTAILPEAEDFGLYFATYFVLYRPMHTVSGDFYWLAEVEDKVFLAVIDCTGHGVPGAFMSMIGNTLLNKILKEQHLLDPAFILAMLDMEVRLALRQDQEKNDDGMDVSLCMFEGLKSESGNVSITFSGAKGKLFYTQKGELCKIGSSRRSIGGKGKTKHEFEAYENFTVELSRGERIFLASDGYCDQPSPTRKKFGAKNFVDLLQTNIHLSLEAQSLLLSQTLDSHLGAMEEQRDDITVVGVEL